MACGKKIRIVTVLTIVLLQSGLKIGSANDQATKILESIDECLECNERTGLFKVKGSFQGISFKAKMLHVATESGPILVDYNDDTYLTGVNAFQDIVIGQEIEVYYREKEGALIADSVDVKKIPEAGQITFISVDELALLVEQEELAGTYTLIDSRPGNQYYQGHIPGAISIYDAKLKKQPDLLPKDKSRLLIFYCSGTS